MVRFDTHEPGQTIVGTISGMIGGDQILSIERAQYWPDPAPSWYEAHHSFGVTFTATRWGLAEGRVGMAGNYQTYILWANPNADPSDVTITFLRESGATLVKSFTVQPGNRFNVAVSGPDTPEIVNERFGVVITATRPIAVERAMYSDQGGVHVAGGHERHRDASSVVFLKYKECGPCRSESITGWCAWDCRCARSRSR